MKESGPEEFRTKKAEFLDGVVLADVGRYRRRSLSNSKAGRGLFLRLLTVFCILLLSIRLLCSYTPLFSWDGTSQLVKSAMVRGESALRSDSEQRVKENETIFNAKPTPTDGEDGDNALIELPQREEKNDDEDNDVTGEGNEKVAEEKKATHHGDEAGEEEDSGEESDGKSKVSDAISFLEQLSLNLSKTGEQDDNGPYHNRRIFESDYAEMKRSIKIFVYPSDRKDPFVNIYKPADKQPSGNYASEEFFQQSLQRSGFMTDDSSKANFFFMPISITKARLDKRINVGGLKEFCGNYVENLRSRWSHWNRSSGADHFYLSCHSIARTAMDNVPYVRENAIQLLCPSSYYLPNYITHKDASVPQVWPRARVTPKESGGLTPEATQRRNVLAFFAGTANSPVRRELIKHWANDDKIMVHEGHVPYPYSQALMTSKFCLQAKGFEVNTARLADSMFYGCVPVVIANHYDLPYQDVLDWTKFSIVVAHEDISLLRKILEAVTDEQYAEYHKQVMLARRHFQWHSPPQDYDAFYTVMYELWKRRHVVRRSMFN